MDYFAPELRPSPLRLRTSPNDLKTTQCMHRYEAHPASLSCRQSQRVLHSPLADSRSDFSTYTARICPSISSLPRSPLTLSPVSSSGGLHSPTSSTASSIIVSRISTPSAAPPTLRRKISPTETSLREIRASQQRLQMKESEDQLRKLYERQTLEYLYSDYASLDVLQE